MEAALANPLLSPALASRCVGTCLLRILLVERLRLDTLSVHAHAHREATGRWMTRVPFLLSPGERFGLSPEEDF